MIVNFKLRTGSFFFMGKISLSRHNTQDVDLDTLTYEEKKQLLAYYNKGFGYFVTTPKLDEVLVLPEICGETPEPNVQTDTPFSVFVSEDGTKITGNSIAKANIEVRGEDGEVIASGLAKDEDGTFSIILEPAKENREVLKVYATLPPKTESEPAITSAPYIIWINNSTTHYMYLSSIKETDNNPSYINIGDTAYTTITTSISIEGESFKYNVDSKIDSKTVKTETGIFKAYTPSTTELTITEELLPEDKEVIPVVSSLIFDNTGSFTKSTIEVPIYSGPYVNTVPLTDQTVTLDTPLEIELKGYAANGRKTFPINSVTHVSNPNVNMTVSAVKDFNKVDVTFKEIFTDVVDVQLIIDDSTTFSFNAVMEQLENWIKASDIITARMLDTEGTPTYALLAGTAYTLDMSCNVDKETKAKVFINSSTNNSSENSELTITFDTTDTTNSIPFPIESNQTGLYSFVASDSTSSFANSILEVRSFTRLTPMSNSSTIQFENSIVSGQVISFEITGYTPDETPIDMTDVFMYSEHPLLNIDSYAISSQNKLNARFKLLDPSLSSVTTNVGFVINNEYTIQTEITVTNT